MISKNKKIMLLLMTSLCLYSLVGCSKNTSENKDTQNTETQTQESSAASKSTLSKEEVPVLGIYAGNTNNGLSYESTLTGQIDTVNNDANSSICNVKIDDSNGIVYYSSTNYSTSGGFSIHKAYNGKDLGKIVDSQYSSFIIYESNLYYTDIDGWICRQSLSNTKTKPEKICTFPKGYKIMDMQFIDGNGNNIYVNIKGDKNIYDLTRIDVTQKDPAPVALRNINLWQFDMSPNFMYANNDITKKDLGKTNIFAFKTTNVDKYIDENSNKALSNSYNNVFPGQFISYKADKFQDVLYFVDWSKNASKSNVTGSLYAMSPKTGNKIKLMDNVGANNFGTVQSDNKIYVFAKTFDKNAINVYLVSVDDAGELLSFKECLNYSTMPNNLAIITASVIK